MQTQVVIQLEQVVPEALRRTQSEQWSEENCEAVKAYNEKGEAHGIFSDDVRSF